MKLNHKTLLKMLSYKRPAWSTTEHAFIQTYIDTVPGMYSDAYGNRILAHPNSKTMISCHTDTVHRVHGMQRVRYKDGRVDLPILSDSNCLGADCTAGVYAALRMIEAGVPATFVFHRAEEIGGQGSSWLADNYPEWIASFNVCLALDRRGTSDVIIEQWGGPTASVQFALSLIGALGMVHVPTHGIFTDSANYAHLIPECSNISIGYSREHSSSESLNTDYLEALIPALCAVDWSGLQIVRDPNESFDRWDAQPNVSFEFDSTAWDNFDLDIV